MNNHLKRGFTLIELMVVITIIAILAGLLITLIPEVMRKVKIADTNTRMNAVHAGMALIGQNEGSTTFRLQQMLEYTSTGIPLGAMEPGLGGIITFGPPNSSAPPAEVGLPTIGRRPENPTLPYGAWGFRGRGHLAFPWGKKFNERGLTEDQETSIKMGPERFLLRHMSPFNTRKILNLANILEKKASETVPTWGEKQYMTNRKTSMGWNDAWGHPLVVASALYQPTLQSGPSLASLPGWKEGAWKAVVGAGALDPTQIASPSSYMPSTEPYARKMLLGHMRLYQYNRSVYIAVAAVGPSVRVTEALLKSPSPTDWGSTPSDKVLLTGTLDILWNQANNVCQQAKTIPFDRDWSELSWDNPPWQGNKYDYLTPSKKLSDANYIDVTTRALIYDGIAPYKGKEEHCMLSAPLEYK